MQTTNPKHIMKKHPTLRFGIVTASAALLAAPVALVAAPRDSQPDHTQPTRDHAHSADNPTADQYRGADGSMKTDRTDDLNTDQRRGAHAEVRPLEAYKQVTETSAKDRQITDLIGAPVVDRFGHELGNIEDFHYEDSELVGATVTIGATFGLGGTVYYVPFEDLSIQTATENDELSVRLNAKGIQELSKLEPSLRDLENEAEDTADRVAANVEQGAEELEREAKDLMKDLKSDLRDDDTVSRRDLSNVDIEVKDDRLILRGKVQNEEIRDAIVDAAEDLKNFSGEVVDELEVRDSYAAY